MTVPPSRSKSVTLHVATRKGGFINDMGLDGTDGRTVLAAAKTRQAHRRAMPPDAEVMIVALPSNG